ncbi:MAG TPA: ABC transporter ATP-binding protein [Actinospica sp.]|jgi:peptide/nickel transport system ATP-binding protein|nr:ABC transporter ATP-binding protein [Actinospica sp.]
MTFLPLADAEEAAAPADGAVLRVRDLHVSFPARTGRSRRTGSAVHAVRGLSFDVAPHEVVGIVGESGSGKSVSATAIMGLLAPGARVAGSVRLAGRELLGLGDRELSALRGRKLSMVFQDPLSALTPVYSIGYQLIEAIRVHRPGISARDAGRRAAELLDLVGIPSAAGRLRAFPHEFSGGMRQRVVIAMAIANDPDLIICDEPTTALDVTIQAQILDVLRTARQQTGAGIVMITHDLGVVAGLADRVVVMYAGRAVESGGVDEVYRRPRMPYTMGLLGSIPRIDAAGRAPLVPIDGAPPSPADLPPGCPFEPRCPMATEVCAQSEPPLAQGADGRWAACHHADRIAAEDLTVTDVYPVPEFGRGPREETPRDERPVVLEVEGLVKHHPLMAGALLRRRVGTVYAVDGVDFQVREAETLAIVGESGCGKTTTLLEVMNLLPPQAGRIRVGGRDVAGLDRAERRALRRDLQIVFQDPMASLDPRLPVGAIIAEPLTAHGRPRAEIGGRVRDLMSMVGLDPEDAERYPQHFSGGQRQRVGIARALALEPRLLVLDEPVSALDVSIQAGVVNLLEELKARLGLSYLFVAHDLAVVRHIADRVAIMYLGRIVEQGAVDELFADPRHPYTRALLSAVPIPDPVKERARRRLLLTGDLPNPARPPSGCRFRTRCPLFAALGDAERARCTTEQPLPAGAGRQTACHHADHPLNAAAPAAP